MKKVGGKLQRDDLLMLEVSTHHSRLSLSAVGLEPETIVRSHADLSIMIVHFPA